MTGKYSPGLNEKLVEDVKNLGRIGCSRRTIHLSRMLYKHLVIKLLSGAI